MLPPLRDRKEDIPAISEAILVNINKKLRMPDNRSADGHARAISKLRLARKYSRAAECAGARGHHGGRRSDSPEASRDGAHGRGERTARERCRSRDAFPYAPAAGIAGDSYSRPPGLCHYGEEIEDAYINLVLQRRTNNGNKDKSRPTSSESASGLAQSPGSGDEKQSEQCHWLKSRICDFYGSGNVKIQMEPPAGAGSIQRWRPPWASTEFSCSWTTPARPLRRTSFSLQPGERF